MIYFKNDAGDIFAYNDGEIAPNEMVRLTKKELHDLLNPPKHQPTISEQIFVLEASITPRNLRGAALGDQFAIDKIKAVEDEIQALRG